MNFFSFNNNSLLYAFRILVGCMIVWLTLNYFHDSKKVWALISVIIISDPDFENVRNSTISRVVNTLTGCLLGIFFIYFTGVNLLSLMLAITVAVVISTSFKKYPTSWKLAPVTVAIIMASAISEDSPVKGAMEIALSRTAEVLYGSAVAFALGLILFYMEKRMKHLNTRDEDEGRKTREGTRNLNTRDESEGQRTRERGKSQEPKI